MILQLSKCTLRPLRPGDEESLAKNANNRKIWINLRDRFPSPYSVDDAISWIEVAVKEPDRIQAIEVDGKAVGCIGVDLHKDIERVSGEIGYWIGEPYWGRGITTEAVRAVCTPYFNSFDLSRIYAGVLAWNPASVRVLEKAGFQKEGILKNAVIKDGKVMDSLLYAKYKPAK